MEDQSFDDSEFQEIKIDIELEDKKEEEKKNRGFGAWIAQKFKSGLTNITYNCGYVRHGLTNAATREIKSTQHKMIFLQGKKYSSIEEGNQALQYFFWFTYREEEGLYLYLSDTLWGCLLRCGQMLMASTLRKFLEENISHFQMPELEHIIRSFNSAFGSEDKYSLPKMLKLFEKSKEGHYFSPHKVCWALQKLHNSQDPKDKYSRLKVLHSEWFINIGQVHKMMGYPPCTCSTKHSFCDTKCHRNCLRKQEENFQTFFSQRIDQAQYQQTIDQFIPNNLLMTISVRLGLGKIEQKFKEIVLELIKMKECMGILGGKQKKGYYFVGCISDSQSLIYLDPHKKHAKVTRENFDNQKHTFFCDQMKWLHIDNVNPQMTLAFYLKDLNDLARIVKKFASFKDNSPVGINRK